MLEFLERTNANQNLSFTNIKQKFELKDNGLVFAI